jgi:uncharacterized integral membrane protein
MRIWERLSQIVRFIALAVLLALAIIWCTQNRQMVSVSLMPLSYGVELPLFLLVLLLLASAYGLAYMQAFFQQLNLKRRIKALQRRLEAIELSQTQEQLAKRLQEETSRDAVLEDLELPPADGNPSRSPLTQFSQASKRP